MLKPLVCNLSENEINTMEANGKIEMLLETARTIYGKNIAKKWHRGHCS